MGAVVIALWFVALIFILIPLKNIIFRAIKLKRCTEVTSGVITEIQEKVRHRDHTTSREYIPTVRYSAGGAEYTRKFAKAYVANTYTVGQTVEIQYNPANPKEIHTTGQSNKWDLIIMGIGVLIALVGVVLLAFN